MVGMRSIGNHQDPLQRMKHLLLYLAHSYLIKEPAYGYRFEVLVQLQRYPCLFVPVILPGKPIRYCNFGLFSQNLALNETNKSADSFLQSDVKHHNDR